LSDKWKAIQRWAGAVPDGDPGERTAEAIIAKTGLLVGERGPELVGVAPLVTGKGKAIRRIVIHCTATREGHDVDAATIRKWHQDKGWQDIGYHFVVRPNGAIERGRPEEQPGSHVAGFNAGSIGVVYVGGLDAQGRAKDTRTPLQTVSLALLVADLVKAYPGARVMGHRDLSPDKDGDGVIERHEWLKDCPCFDVAAWWSGVST
jgi:N-acetylmuramoyl-L-alanine amidase